MSSSLHIALLHRFDCSTCRLLCTFQLHTVLELLCLQIIALSFGFFYTEACCDYVSIYDGNSLTSTQLVRLYGNSSTSAVYQSTQQYMYIRFTSDSSLSFQGFTANFYSTTRKHPFNSASLVLTASSHVLHEGASTVSCRGGSASQRHYADKLTPTVSKRHRP